MDEDDIFALLFLLTIFTLPLTLVLLTTALIAYSRTKKWAAANNKSVTLPTDPEASSALLPTKNNADAEDDEDDDDYLDTEDEAEQTAAKAEAEADKHKTFAQMWRKEFRKVWSGKGAKGIAREREREERRKLAKAVARELDRRERRRERRAMRERAKVNEEIEMEGLPRYEK
ncbi:hypothetical protein DM02DRAFT_68366 [Periconia macrospinosa]|uniref:Uncharacterized protein n=1 Tax=Periconia macrospinosa TaxID=97972 RepID=A0A2V1E7N7_9PLEO|nr:hypothetical protein DM02DRAFT_68366 [Periconia macrospinosa]